ncbi:MAG: Ig-like domain-containing protein [Deltaproteobacteria bacterium]|nr:Ig-like domain-containing protein [Deltaproteobacteria bacterium]
MRRLLVVLPLFAAALACPSSNGPGTSSGTTQAAQTGLAPPPPPDITPIAAPDASAVSVVSARPQGELSGLDHPTITFSKPILPLGTLEQADQTDLSKGVTLSPKAEGAWHWLGSSSLEFIPARQLPYSTEYTITVPKGFVAIDGTRLADAYTFKFHTPQIQVQNVQPDGDRCRWSKADQSFDVTVNQPLAAADQAFFFELKGGEKVAAKITKSVNVQDERIEQEKARPEGSRPRFERADPDALKFKNQQTRYTLQPVKPLPLATPFVLALDVNAKAAQGPLPIGGESRSSCSTYGPMEFAEFARCAWDNGHCTRGPPSIKFTNPIGSLDTLAPHVSFEPPLELAWKDVTSESEQYMRFDSDTGLRLPASLKPGTRYKIKISAGVPDTFGQTTQKPFEQEFSTDDLEPSIWLGSHHGLYEADGDGKLPLQVTNIPTLNATLWELSLEEYQAQRGCTGQCAPPRGASVTVNEPLPYPKNESHIHGIDLRKALKDGKKTGLVYVRIPNVAHDRPDLTSVAQITDLVPHAKIGLTSSVVWVTSLSKGTPVPDATVRVYAPGGRVTAEGKTDQDGLVNFGGSAELTGNANAGANWEEPKVMVAALLDGDVGVSTTDWDGTARGENISYELDALAQSPLGSLFTDRGLYRPGDTVHVKGVLRRKDSRSATGLLTMPEGTAIKVETNDREGEAIDTHSVKLSRYGTFTFDLKIPKEAKLGGFSMHATDVGAKGKGSQGEWSGNFRVAEYRAPTFRVDVLTPKAQLFTGDTLAATVSARYLFGGAMTGASASWSVTRNANGFSPPGQSGFLFGPQSFRSWSDEGENMPQEQPMASGFVASGKGTIDKTGNLAIDAGKTETPGGSAVTYTIESEVTDVSRQAQAGRVEIVVHPASFYVGLGATSIFAEAGKPLTVPVIAASPDGKRVEGVEVKVAAVLREFHSVKKQGVGGVYQTVNELVETELTTCAVTTKIEAQACTLTIAKAGEVTLRATAKDAQGHTAMTSNGVYVLGPGYSSWARGDSAHIDVVADKAEYAVGDVAKVLVKSPYSESLALISVEREGVSQRHIQKLSGTAVTIDVPITEEMVPDIFVGVLLVRPRVADGNQAAGEDPGRPAMKVGFAELKVGTQVKRLSVDVKPSKPDWQPRQKVPVALTVKDAAGKPAKAELQVYAVDDGVLRLAGYQVPDLIADMFPHRGLGVTLAEPILSLVRRQRFGEKGDLQPGGGGGREESSEVRGKFLTTVLWKTVETDDQGQASVEIELPDNLTTFRIMAVALTQADRFGAGQSEVHVSLPLLIQPALPRFAHTGDEFEAGVVVNTNGLASDHREVTVKAELTGAVSLADGQPAEQKVTLEDGVAREVRFKLKATGTGPAKFVFKASAQGAKGETYKDGVEQTIPVELPVQMEAVATYGDTDKKATEGLVPPANVRPDQGGLTVTMSSTALGGMGDAMEQLWEYPYGCAEQLSSRLMPLVAVREVQKVFGVAPKATDKHVPDPVLAELLHLAPDETAKVDAAVNDTIHKLEALQNPSGGFRYWTSSTCEWPWLSTYVTLTLHRAREAGYAVKRPVLDNAKRYLATVAAGGVYCGSSKISAEERVFALQVLARMGDPRPAFYDELLAQKDHLALFGKAQLADAIAIGKGSMPKAQALLTEIMNSAQESPAGVHFEEKNALTYAPLFSSDTRTTGMVLQTLADVNPTHPYVGKIARYLTGVRRKDGSYRNTQEAAYALMGLTEVVRAREKSAPDFTAKVTLGGAELFTQAFKGRSLAVITKSLPMSEVVAKTAGKSAKDALPFEFAVDGTGMLTYGALMRYAPKELPLTPRDEGLFVQRWFERYDTPGQMATEFNAGELVRVRVRIATRMQRDYVAIEVPLPAGLEAVDLQLATTARLPREQHAEAAEGEESEGFTPEGDGAGEGEGEASDYVWSPFVWSEKRDDRVLYFSDHLPAGVQVQSFIARATTPGKFLLKPAKAEEMYTPEVFGRSDGGSITISAGKPLSQK